MRTSSIGYSNFIRYINKLDSLLMQGQIPGIDFIHEVRLTSRNNMMCIIKPVTKPEKIKN